MKRRNRDDRGRAGRLAEESADAGNCPPWCAADDDRDDRGRPLHASEWEGTTHYEDGADWHALARAVRDRDQAGPAAVQLAVYAGGQEVIVTLTPGEAEEVADALTDSAQDAREPG